MRFPGRGVQLKLGDGAATEVFTKVAQVIDVDGPGLKKETEDVTDNDSTNAWREHVETLKDAGEITFGIHYDPAAATHDPSTGVLSALKGSGPQNWKLVFPDTAATEWAFAASVTDFKPGMPHEGKLTADITLKLSGEPTLA